MKYCFNYCIGVNDPATRTQVCDDELQRRLFVIALAPYVTILEQWTDQEKLKPTGDATRDTLVEARINLRRED